MQEKSSFVRGSLDQRCPSARFIQIEYCQRTPSPLTRHHISPGRMIAEFFLLT
jgi:hypothetical protein